MDLGEIGWGRMDWICRTQDRYIWRVLVNTVMNLRFHKMLRYSSVVERLGGFSRRAQHHGEIYILSTVNMS
jgi:hypothetical protein